MMLAALLPILGPLVTKLADTFFPDPAQKQKFIQDFYTQIQQSDLSQLDVNKAEAANPSIFVAGWRPFIGWVCGGALFYSYVLVPLGLWAAAWFGLYVPKPPVLDSNLWELITGMLGMGALRSYEKIKGMSK